MCLGMHQPWSRNLRNPHLEDGHNVAPGVQVTAGRPQLGDLMPGQAERLGVSGVPRGT